MEILTGIVTVPAIVALVNLFKRLGVTNQIGLVLAVFIGVLLNVAQYFWGAEGWYSAVTNGLLMGLAASGLYDLAPSTGEGTQKPEEPVIPEELV